MAAEASAANQATDAIRYRPECGAEAVQAVLAALHWWSRRSEPHHSNHRRHARREYDEAVYAQPLAIEGRADAQLPPRPVWLQVQARNLSQGGISLLAAPRFVPELVGDDTPLLSAERIFRLGRPMAIGLHPAPGKLWWVEGEIVRARMVHQGFLDVGVRFLRRRDGHETAAS